MSHQSFNPSMHTTIECTTCKSLQSGREVLLAIVTRLGVSFTLDTVCLTCGTTEANGKLPPEASETFLLPSAAGYQHGFECVPHKTRTHDAAYLRDRQQHRGPDLPFGSR
jgi:hypothetical protein